MKKPSRQLESSIERNVVEYAKSLGWLVIKLSTSGFRGSSGYPDRMFIRAGKVLFIEFKAPGKLPTPLQQRRHAELQQHGARVVVCDTVHSGRRTIDEETDG